MAENNQHEFEFENQRLEQTISLAEKQLMQARNSSENNKQAIIEAKREMRENTVHSVSNLWSSEGFEDLAALTQYVNPIMIKIATSEVV